MNEKAAHDLALAFTKARMRGVIKSAEEESLNQDMLNVFYKEYKKAFFGFRYLLEGDPEMKD